MMRPKRSMRAKVIAAALWLTMAAPVWSAPGVQLTGVNLSGAEFNGGKLPGRPYFDYVYPNAQEVAYFTAKGANIFRVPVLWERLQPALNAPLDRGELGRLRATVELIERNGGSVVIDIHNFGGYRGHPVGSPETPYASFADLWSRIATAFSGDSKVHFGLMNEPIAMTGPALRTAIDAAIAGIRSTGSKNLILAPGVGWSGAHDFVPASGAVLADIRDPAHNIAYEAHQYLDQDHSGTHWVCVDAKTAQERLLAMTKWLRAHKQRGFLGEFGAADNPQCLESLDALLIYMRDNSDVWMGWTYWAAGAWWGDYPMSVEPKNGLDRGQMIVLKRSFVGAKNNP